MLDVHPPHKATHTWTDFFLHIATICIGLLIAIGLEQSVELMHHRHQRHQLQEDLHAETVRNIQLSLSNLDDCDAAIASEQATYEEVVRANHAHRPPVLNDPPAPNRYVKPAIAVGTVARQNGTFGLLPRAEEQQYTRAYGIAQQAGDALSPSMDAGYELLNALAPGKALLTDSQLKLAPAAQASATWVALSPEDFRDARNALGKVITARKYEASRNVLLYATEWAVLRGVSSDKETIRIFFDASHAYQQAGKAAMLAKYPVPQEAETPPAEVAP